MDKRTVLLIVAGVFVLVVLLVAIGSALMGHHAPAAAATVTALASAEAARRTLAVSTAKVETGEKEAVKTGAAIEKTATEAEAKIEKNTTDIAAMTLEEKVALANGHDPKDVTRVVTETKEDGS